jgi:hypothetical protein
MKAPPRVTLSAGSGLFDPVFVEWEQSTTDCHSALPRQAKIDERSGNVDENKGQPISVDCRSADLPTADGVLTSGSIISPQFQGGVPHASAPGRRVGWPGQPP